MDARRGWRDADAQGRLIGKRNMSNKQQADESAGNHGTQVWG